VERKVLLTSEDYVRSVKFALKLWYAEKPKSDWRSTGTIRDLGDYITDWAEGKLAEIAFGKFLESNWGIKVDLDFNVYRGPRAIDRGDVAAIEVGGIKREPKIKMDVKSTKPDSKWATVDLKEFEKRRYDVYVWVKVGLPLDHFARPIFEALRGENLIEIESKIPPFPLKQIEAEIAGFAYREDVEKWQTIKAGSFVCDPQDQKKKLFKAKTDNRAAPLRDLRNSVEEWNELVKKILEGALP